MATALDGEDEVLRSKYKKRLFRYIEEDNRSKFKSYVKKHKISVESVKIGSSETLMHQVCFKGAENIMRYLLQKRVDLLAKNDYNEIPLHKACRYLLSTRNKHAYSDIVKPLIEASKVSLSCPDKDGVTPQDILFVWQERKQSDSSGKAQDRVESSSSEGTDSSGSSDDNKRWSQHLKDETEAEYATNWGTYENDFYQDYEETNRDWGDRIAQEYREKHKRKNGIHEKKTSSKKKKEEREAEEERNREFQRKLEEEHNEYIERVKKARESMQLKSMVELKKQYELQSKKLFQNPKETVGYRDIPWPYPKERGIKVMKDFLLCDINQNDTKTLKKYLREQQVRWHPDKFVQKCGQLLKESEKEKIINRVNQVSQELNRIADEIL